MRDSHITNILALQTGNEADFGNFVTREIGKHISNPIR